MTNPLLQDWNTPYGLPPFEAAQPAHFAPAFERAFEEHAAEIERIATDGEAPDFDNTIAAFDRSGRLLKRVAAMFFNLASSEASPALQAIEREIAPRMAAHQSAIYLHAGLFGRIALVHAQRDVLAPRPEQRRLVERIHLDFVREGALLSAADKQRYAQLMQSLATLTTRFGQNVLADESAFRLALEGEADLAGLPTS